MSVTTQYLRNFQTLMYNAFEIHTNQTLSQNYESRREVKGMFHNFEKQSNSEANRIRNGEPNVYLHIKSYPIAPRKFVIDFAERR